MSPVSSAPDTINPTTPMTDEQIDDIIALHYQRGSRLWNILLTHSHAVADLADAIVDAHPELHADAQFVHEASLLHDIGIVMTDAPSIDCHGSLPYICHGIEGRKILDSHDLPRHALVCERHTGSGLSLDYIVAANLPLPHRDMTPQSIEEKIVCYADKFYSKSKNLTEMKPFERALRSVSKYGDESAARFLAMDAQLRIPKIK